jgi:hypothetical protein
MRLAAVLFVLLAGLMPAAGQDASPDTAGIEAVLRNAGLFGTWAVDCSAPAAPANPHVTVLIADAGAVVERHELGPDYEVNDYRVIDAKRLSPVRVSVDVLFKPGREGEEEQHLVFAVEHGTRRTLFNRVAGGAVVVKDGFVAGRRIRTPTLRKCG